MFSSMRMKYCASFLIIFIVLLNTVSLEAGKIGKRKPKPPGRTTYTSIYKPPPIYKPPLSIYKPPIRKPPSPTHKPTGPVYKPPGKKPTQPPRVTTLPPYVRRTTRHPPVVHTAKPPVIERRPTPPGKTLANQNSDPNTAFISTERGGGAHPGNPTGVQKPHDTHDKTKPGQNKPTAPVNETPNRVNTVTKNNANPDNYPSWANPGADPRSPNYGTFHPASPTGPQHPIPLPPHGPNHPSSPILPPRSHPYDSPNPGMVPPLYPIPRGPPNIQGPPQPPYYAPPYPGSHPPGMPIPQSGQSGFVHGGIQPVSNGGGHHSGTGGIPPPTVINNFNYHPPPNVHQNPSGGHPMTIHPSVSAGTPPVPLVPGHTVVVLPPQQIQSSSPGLGQMFQQALVNTVVDRALGGGSHHHTHTDIIHTSDPVRPPSTTSTVTNTVIYNNQYGNANPASNGNPNTVPNQMPNSSVPPNPPQTAQPGTVPGNPPTFPASQPTGNVNSPGGGVPTGSANPAAVNSGMGTTGPGIPNSGNQQPFLEAAATSNSPQSGNSSRASIDQPTASYHPNTSDQPPRSSETIADQEPPTYQWLISDDSLTNFTELLFSKDEINAEKYITLNLQRISVGGNLSDLADGRLLFVGSSIDEVPTINAVRKLYDNYEFDSEKKENASAVTREEENTLLTDILDSDIMITTMKFLASYGYVDPDEFEWKDTLRHMWFSKMNGATSGFERIFMAEKYPTEYGPTITGAQNWIYFEHMETQKRINYLSYSDHFRLGDKASLVKVNFQIDDFFKANTTMLVGTPPELEMGLYTLCYYARPTTPCPVSLGGKLFGIWTEFHRYFGKDLISAGFMFS